MKSADFPKGKIRKQPRGIKEKRGEKCGKKKTLAEMHFSVHVDNKAQRTIFFRDFFGVKVHKHKNATSTTKSQPFAFFLYPLQCEKQEFLLYCWPRGRQQQQHLIPPSSLCIHSTSTISHIFEGKIVMASFLWKCVLEIAAWDSDWLLTSVEFFSRHFTPKFFHPHFFLFSRSGKWW